MQALHNGPIVCLPAACRAFQGYLQGQSTLLKAHCLARGAQRPARTRFTCKRCTMVPLSACLQHAHVIIVVHMTSTLLCCNCTRVSCRRCTMFAAAAGLQYAQRIIIKHMTSTLLCCNCTRVSCSACAMVPSSVRLQHAQCDDVACRMVAPRLGISAPDPHNPFVQFSYNWVQYMPAGPNLSARQTVSASWEVDNLHAMHRHML